MAASLHILVVDDRPDSVLFLTEFLLSRHQRVETCGNGTEALEAVMRRHRTSDGYDLVISDVTMPGMDGLSLLRELRRRQMLVPLALYTAYGSMNPTLQQQATQLGCITVLDKPLELRRVERLIEEVASRRSGTHSLGKPERNDQPFFGTSRVARISSPGSGTAPGGTTEQPTTGALERKPGTAPPPLPTLPIPPPPPPEMLPLAPPTDTFTQYPTTSFTRRTAEPQTKPHTAGYVRRPSGLFLEQGGNVKGPTTTARIRRSISGSHLPPPAGAQPPAPPVPPQPPPGNSQSRAVACAHCRKIFLVLSKTAVYNAVCVHCGGLNRIDPL